MAKGRRTANKDAPLQTVKKIENGEIALAINVVKTAVHDYTKLRRTIEKATKELKKVVKFFKSENFDFYCDLIGEVDADVLRGELFNQFGGEPKFSTIEFWDEILKRVVAETEKGGTDNGEEE